MRTFNFGVPIKVFALYPLHPITDHHRLSVSDEGGDITCA